MDLQESDEDYIKMEKTNIITRSKNEAEGSTILYSKPNGNVDFKNGTIRHLWPFRKQYQKENKTTKKTALIKRQPGSGRKKIIDEVKECFILEHLAGNPFLSKTKIDTLLKAQFKDLEISEISIRRFLIKKGRNGKALFKE